MADGLRWREGTGYDIHLLRGGPETKRLIDALDVTSAQAAQVGFIHNLLGHDTNHGVQLDASTGIVKALTHPDTAWPRVTNFLLSALFPGTGGTLQAKIRIHVHDFVKDIWLTPSPLTLHENAADCYFTVLARFNDDVVGDITEWSQLTYKSVDPATSSPSTDVLISPTGLMTPITPGKGADITVSLTQPKPPTSLTSSPGKALVKARWSQVGKDAKVVFVAGGTVPNKSDPDSSARDSVKSVVENATNILFVSEGFRQDQRGDFNNLVHIVTRELLTKSHLLPFKLLKDRVNYWSVFVPSREEGLSLLGDWTFESVHFRAGLIPLPVTPDPAATEWSLPEMIHEVGLPIAEEVEIPFLPDHVSRWSRLYGAHITEDQPRKRYLAWTLLAQRSLLNERDSAFGMSIADRPRASHGHRQSNSLRCDSRRTSEFSLMKFVQNLTYGGHPIGSTWQAGGKDFGLASFVCLSDLDAGQGRRNHGYFTSSFGVRPLARVEPVAGRGLNLKTAAPETNSRTLYASTWAHECGHAFGLWDEYGDGKGAVLKDPADVAPFPNVLAKASITTLMTDPVTGATTPVFDKTKEIKWLWPRVTKAGVLKGIPERAASGFHFRVPLRKGHGKAFGAGDIVRFREWPVVTGASLDPFLKFLQSTGFTFKLKVPNDDEAGVDLEDATGNAVDVDSPHPSNPDPRSWKVILLELFKTDSRYALICPRTAAGVEIRLISEPIFTHIQAKGPLTAEPGFDPALCVPASNPYSVMSPTNLPSFSKAPRNHADIIGIYEGGGYHDCGVFRPAGRCKMRAAHDKTIPFCHVCRYLLVDRIDPTRHAKLDAIYPEVTA